jgi:hypothetical protein
MFGKDKNTHKKFLSKLNYSHSYFSKPEFFVFNLKFLFNGILIILTGTLVACCVTKCQEAPIRLAQIWPRNYNGLVDSVVLQKI